MKNFSFSIFNIASLVSVFLLVGLILLPFNLINMEQAERIAKWKASYEKLKYCFELVNLHEGSIIPTAEEAGKIITDEYIFERLMPYFNLKSDEVFNPYKYGYRKLNGSPVLKTSRGYFDKFVERKDSILIGIKQNQNASLSKNEPLYNMFVDINGIEKPNKVGQDIFGIDIYKHSVNAMGSGKTAATLKANCSPIGSGLYCSEYYLMGGQF